MLVTRSYYIWLPKIILGRFPLDIPGRKMLRTVEAVVKNKNKKCSEIREKKLSTQTSGTSLNLILGAIKPLSALSSSIYVNFFYPQSWKDTAFVCNWRIDQLASESTSEHTGNPSRETIHVWTKRQKDPKNKPTRHGTSSQDRGLLYKNGKSCTKTPQCHFLRKRFTQTTN